MIKYESVAVDVTARVAETAVIGAPFRPLCDRRQRTTMSETLIGANSWIGHHTMIGQGAVIGAGTIIEDQVRVEAEAIVGERVLVISRSQICLGAKIADDCVIKGYVGDYCEVGKGCRIAGELIHRQLDPSIPWDDPAADEPAPVVADGAFVGWRAVVVGDVKIGAGAYICAGALITRDVPAHHIAYGRNQIAHPTDWPGALGKSPFFQAGVGQLFQARVGQPIPGRQDP